MTVAEVVIAKTDLLGTKQQSYPALLQDTNGCACRMFIQQLCGGCSSRSRTAVVPTTSAQSATASATVLNSSAFLRRGLCTDGGACFAESEAKGIHEAQQ